MSAYDDDEITQYLRKANAEVRALQALLDGLTFDLKTYLAAIEEHGIGPSIYRRKVEGELQNFIDLVEERLDGARRTAAFD